MTHPNKKSRSCAGCTVCCTHLEIESRPGYSTRPDTGEDVAKASGETCRFAGPGGCTIYASRPPVCREFSCDFILGRAGYGADDRPDASGFLGVRGTRFFFGAPRRAS